MVNPENMDNEIEILKIKKIEYCNCYCKFIPYCQLDQVADEIYKEKFQYDNY